jgi:sugar phosphate isomerase/epimerase
LFLGVYVSARGGKSVAHGKWSGMKFAVFTVSVPEWDPATAAKQIAAAGYDGVEWRVTEPKDSPDGKPGFWAGNRCTWPAASFADDVPAIRFLTEAAGLTMPALGTYLRSDTPAEIETTMRAAQQLGVPQLRVSSGGYDAAQRHRAVGGTT